MLITFRKGTNETLKNHENALFSVFLGSFLIFFPEFLGLSHFLVVLLQLRKKVNQEKGL